MAHLTVEEIIEFVSFGKLSGETIELATKVNEHIRSCPRCLKKVSAFQTVYDEFCRIGSINDAKKCVYSMTLEDQIDLISENELKNELHLSDDDQMNDVAR